MQATLELRIPSRFEDIDLVDRVTDSLLRFLGFDEQSTERSSLAVREAVANAVEHGNRLDATKPVDIRYAVEGEDLVVQVRDQGQGFDPGALPDPLAPENLLKPKGRGIFLIRTFMDQVDFSFNNPVGTVVTMRRRSADQATDWSRKENQQK